MIHVFEPLRCHPQIVVTGPQRSGTTICAEMIGHDLGLEVFREEFVPNLAAVFALLARFPRAVFQAPHLCHFAHVMPCAIVMMRRPVEAIIKSQNRVGWHCGHSELAKYFRSEGPIAQVKYDCWERYQKPLTATWFEVEYESLQQHPLWVAAEGRRNFNARQTR